MKKVLFSLATLAFITSFFAFASNASALTVTSPKGKNLQFVEGVPISLEWKVSNPVKYPIQVVRLGSTLGSHAINGSTARILSESSTTVKENKTFVTISASTTNVLVAEIRKNIKNKTEEQIRKSLYLKVEAKAKSTGNAGESNRSSTFYLKVNPEIGNTTCPNLSGFQFAPDVHMILGSSGPDVLALQCFLINKGYLNSSIKSGYFGQITKAELAQYQYSKGISETGYFGPLTLKSVNNELKPNQSSSIEVVTVSDNVSNDNGVGLFKISAKVRAIGGDIYIPFTSVRAAVTETSSESGAVYVVKKEDTRVVSLVGESSSSINTNGETVNSGGKEFIRIEENKPVTITLTVTLHPKTSGAYNVEWFRINYSSGITGIPTKSKDLNIETKKLILNVPNSGNQPSITPILVSTRTNVISGQGSNDDIGVFNIKFKVRANDGDAYLSSKANPVGYNFMIDKAGVQVDGLISASITNIKDGPDDNDDLTPAGNYKIEKNTEETLELEVRVPLGNGLTAGLYRSTLMGIKWDTDDDSTPDNAYTDLSNFRTNYQILNSLPQNKLNWVANAWRAFKGVFGVK